MNLGRSPFCFLVCVFSSKASNVSKKNALNERIVMPQRYLVFSPFFEGHLELNKKLVAWPLLSDIHRPILSPWPVSVCQRWAKVCDGNRIFLFLVRSWSTRKFSFAVAQSLLFAGCANGIVILRSRQGTRWRHWRHARATL